MPAQVSTPVPAPVSAPLDPDARAVIDRVNALNAPGYETMPPQTARTIAAHLTRNAPFPRVRVGAVREITLDAGGVPMRARHYLPFRRRTPSPVLVYLHGGGWVLGSPDTTDHLCRSLVRLAGVDVVSLDYPLAPEVRFPETALRCAEAVRALHGEAGALGLDPARIAVGGDSAGGNLAAVLALMARDGMLPALAAQCLIYPALDLRREGCEGMIPPGTLFLADATMEWFTAQYLGTRDADAPDPAPDPALDWRASPLLAPDLTGLPPAWILTAGHDVLRGQGLAYAARLRAAGVVTVARDFAGQIHNFVAMPYAIPTAHVAIAETAEFLLEHLAGETGE